jgi:hypothetical protein
MAHINGLMLAAGGGRLEAWTRSCLEVDVAWRQMKQKLLVLAVIGGLVCVVLALWPARSPLYFTAAYTGMSAGALLALFCVEKPLRWLAVVALLFALMGVYMSWHSHPPGRETVTNPNQGKPAEGPTWIQWSSTHGGNNHWYALTPSATDWDAAEKLAVSWGGTLATITSPQEQDFINDKFLTGKFEHLPLWIGLVRIYTNAAPRGVPIGPSRSAPTFPERLRLAMADLGFHVNVSPHVNTEFAWLTGEDFSYSNWKPGEPSNSPPGESWVAINWEYSDNPPRGIKGDWNDTPMHGTSGYGGATDGPYYGLMELGQPFGPALTPSTWGLITMAALALAAGLAFIFLKRSSVRTLVKE